MIPSDRWLHAHWEMIVLGFSVLWAMLAFAWNSLTAKFVTKTNLEACREDVRQVDDSLESQLHAGFDQISHDIRKISQENSQQHQDIYNLIARLHNEH